MYIPPRKRSYEAFHFDFDGVIVNTFDLCYRNTLVDMNMPLTETQFRNLFNGNVYEGIALATGKSASEVHVDDDPYYIDYTRCILEMPPITGMTTVLEDLHNGEARQLFMLSSSINPSIKKYLEKYRLCYLFDRIYGASVHKNKAVKIKMHLDAFAINPEETVFITVTLGDMREAAHHNIRSIRVSWGFHPRVTLEQENPLAIVDTPVKLGKGKNGFLN